VTVRSIVSCTFHSSLEIYVSVEAVAVDLSKIPTCVPHVKPVQPQMIEVFEGAKTRRNHRLLQRKEIIQKELSTHPEEFEQ
ncbi:9707_t:CDS:2, partial [Cetraspora pellucida]